PMTTTMPRRLVIAAAVLSLAAAVLHFRVMPEHFAEWWGYGAFFLVAVAQTLYAFIVLRGLPSPGFIWAGILGNLAIIIFWAWTRTIGIPLFGPHAGEVEGIGAIDIASKISEALLVACLVLLLRAEGWAPHGGEGAQRQRR